MHMWKTYVMMIIIILMAVIFQMATIHEKKTYTPPSERFPIFLSDILTFTN